MHAVCSDRESNIAAVVYDEQTPRSVDYRRQRRCQVIKQPCLRSLYAKLERADALLESLPGDPLKRPACGYRRIQDKVHTSREKDMSRGTRSLSWQAWGGGV
jgi:hypothetical protein